MHSGIFGVSGTCASVVLSLSVFLASQAMAQEPIATVVEESGKTEPRRKDNQPDPSPRYWAVLIGVDKTSGFPDLRWCGNDVKKMRETLILNSRFKKEHITDLRTSDEPSKQPTRKNIRDAIVSVASKATASDVLLFSFSGHGVFLQQGMQGQSFLCPADSEKNDEKTLIAVDELYEILGGCAARKKIVVLDACRNSAEAKDKFSEQIRRIPENTVCLLSCKAGEESLEDKLLEHGVFMWSVIEGLRGKADTKAFNSKANQNGKVEIDELFDFAARTTAKYTGNRQNPEFVARIDGIDALVDLSDPPATWTEPQSGMTFKLIRRGKFMMGDKRYDNELPVHEVSITDDFYLGTTEVTQEQYERVMRANPVAMHAAMEKGWVANTKPVAFISHADAQAFCQQLARITKLPDGIFRLPTEAEWEYSARAGTKEPFGPAKSQDGLPTQAWFNLNASKRIREVMSFPPNPWGLYDMQGNVAEWCGDWYDPQYYKQNVAAWENPAGPANPPMGRQIALKLLKGGSWFHGAEYCRPGDRNAENPAVKYSYAGFRVVFTARPDIDIGGNSRR